MAVFRKIYINVSENQNKTPNLQGTECFQKVRNLHSSDSSFELRNFEDQCAVPVFKK